MNIIIAGGRDFDNYPLLKTKCENILSNLDKKDIIIFCGTAKGADTLGEWYAKENKLKIKYFKPNWNIGKKAGILRNEEMLVDADALIAFWDGKSRGTKHMIGISVEKGIKTRIIKY